jgi:hypothetical protein
MDQLQLEAMKLALRAGLAKLEAVTVTCRSCESWNNERCKRFEAVPPTDVQRSGCESWSWDGVPF